MRSMFSFIWRGQEKANTERAEGLLKRFKLDAKRDDFAGSLSGGQRKLLEMSRALMVEPELVMLDEPMAGVNPALKQSLLGHVKSLREDGMTVLFVEHDMDMVRDISDWVVVMAQGKVIAEGPPHSVMGDQRVIDAYLGAHHDTALSFEEEEKILAQADAELAAVRGEELPAESVASAQPAAPAGSAAPAEPDAAAEPAAATEDKGARHE
jgi:branched-chain amino acid transport system ATP-binding protein